MAAEENGCAGRRDFDSPGRCSRLFAALSLFALLLLVYSNSFYGEWHFDDYHNIVDNPNVHLQGLTWKDIRATFYGVSDGSEGSRINRPVSYMSFGLNYFFGGTDVFGYHVVNVAIHFAASIFLFLLIFRTLQLPLLQNRYGNAAYGIALLSSVLWAASPLQVHAVAIIVQRMASLAGLGTVMALYFYLRARTTQGKRARWVWSVLCAVSALLAFGSKENAAMLPVSIFLFEVVLIQGATPEALLRVVKFFWAPLALTLVFLFLLHGPLTGIFENYQVRPFTMTERILTAPRITVFYVSLLLYPIPSRLTLLHDIEISRGLFDPWTTFIALAVVLVTLGLAVLQSRRAPLLSFAVLFFALNHLIEGTVIPLELIYEHRNYIPSMFFFVPVAVIMVRCLDYFAYNKRIQLFMAGGFALMLIFLGHTTFERNDIVRSDVHLWLDNVRKSPALSRPHINLARHYYEAGMYDEAYHELKIAEDLNRDTNLRQIGIASYNLGVYYLYQKKDLNRAEQHFLKALERFPGYPPAIAGQAMVHLQKGEVEGAWALMQEHASRFGSHPEMVKTSALVLLKKGDPRGALKAASRAMRLDWNDPQPWELSGEAWRQLGQWRKAAQCWEEALRRNPFNSKAMLALVDLYDRVKDPALAPIAARCLAAKGDFSLDGWLAGLARNSRVSIYEVDPEKLGRIIRRELGRQLAEKR